MKKVEKGQAKPGAMHVNHGRKRKATALEKDLVA